MKKKQLTLITLICIFSLIILGCSQNTKTKNYITFDKLIDSKNNTINTITCSRSFSDRRIIKDKETISRIIFLLKDFNIQEISAEKENEFIQNKVEDYILAFSSDKEIIGAIYVINTNRVLFYGSQNLMSENRAIAYVNIENDENKIKEIINIIENKFKNKN